MTNPPCYVAPMHSPWDRAGLRRVLRRLLKDTGLTPQDIADMAGVSRPQVSRWMSGTNRPGFDATAKLARAIQAGYPGQRDLATGLLAAAGYPHGHAANGASRPMPAPSQGSSDDDAWASMAPEEKRIARLFIETLRSAAAEQGRREDEPA